MSDQEQEQPQLTPEEQRKQIEQLQGKIREVQAKVSVIQDGMKIKQQQREVLRERLIAQGVDLSSVEAAGDGLSKLQTTMLKMLTAELAKWEPQLAAMQQAIL